MVSSSGTDGRLYVTSDTSRLFHAGSDGTMFLGGASSIQGGYPPQGGQKFYYAQESGIENAGAAGLTTVTFPRSGFSGLPGVWLSAWSDGWAGVRGIRAILNLDTVTPTGFTCFLESVPGFVGISNVTIYWMSLGTRTF